MDGERDVTGVLPVTVMVTATSTAPHGGGRRTRVGCISPRCHKSSTRNLTLLCRYHHTHYLTAGWTCQITPDGLPAWAPPRWRDPDQNHLIHHRIRDRHRNRE